MKTIAVVGAGFAGLAATYFLSEQFKVTLFDQTGIGGGASGISSGLLHPYPGEKGRLSWHAEEALKMAKKLVDEAEVVLGRPVAHQGGILRLGPILNPGPDVVMLGPEKFLITSGITVFPLLYLQGLWRLCERRGAVFQQKKMESTDKLQDYDLIVLAVGAGIRFLKEGEGLPINYVKGQLLTCALKTPLERSISAKTYTAVTQAPLECHVGATYEREQIDEIPSLETAVKLLKPTYPVLDCLAGIRVTNPAHYFPVVRQLSPRVWIMTAFGSRGLLYHALMGYRLHRAVSNVEP